MEVHLNPANAKHRKPSLGRSLTDNALFPGHSFEWKPDALTCFLRVKCARQVRDTHFPSPKLASQQNETDLTISRKPWRLLRPLAHTYLDHHTSKLCSTHHLTVALKQSYLDYNMLGSLNLHIADLSR